MKKAIEDFLPHYLEVDYKLPTSYHIKSPSFEEIGNPELRFDNIGLVHPDLNLYEIVFAFTAHEKTPCIVVHLPTVKTM